MPDMSRPGCYKALYERLSPSQQLRFRSLYNAKKIVSFVPLMQLGDVTEGIDEGIARTNIINCHPLGEDVTYPFGGVFAHTSRVNHSYVGPFLLFSTLNYSMFDFVPVVAQT